MSRVHITSRSTAIAIAVAVFLAAPQALAADVTGIGFVDQAQLTALPAFQAANRTISDFGAKLQRQYVARARTASPAEQQRLSREFQSKMAAEQRQTLGPLFGKAQVAIASVASSKNLSIVVDKRIIIYGGEDITKDVRGLLTGPAAPVPPVSTPPPSSVGYVDQTQIDAVPAIKSATQAFGSFKADEDKATAAKMKDAKTGAQRDTILESYQKTLEDKQAQLLEPLIGKTRNAMLDVAHKRGLVLVIDRSNVIFGGTDITADVIDELK